MTTLPKTKVPRKLYAYKDGDLVYLQDAFVETEEYRKEEAWPSAIESDGYRGTKYDHPILMKTLGGLFARIYRKVEPGKVRNKKSIFAPYNFIVDIDTTYIILIDDFVLFMKFSKEYLILPQPDEADTSALDGIKNALWEINSSVSSIASTIDSIDDRLDPSSKRR